MKPLPPVSSSHAGNGYRGPGAWKRPRKKHFAINEGPLDLGRILGNLDRQQRSLHRQHGTKNHPKQGKAAALQKRLESLSLALAPSSGVGQSPALPSTHHHDLPPVLPRGQNPHHDKVGPLPLGHDQPPQHHQPHRNNHHQRPVCGANQVLHGASERGSGCGGALVGNSSSEQQICCTNSIATEETAVLTHGHRSGEGDPQQADTSCSTGKENRPASLPHTHFATLRIPNAATKMSVEDRCTSEILGARAGLRALLNEKTKLGDAMRRRRLEACLGDGGTGGESAVRTRRGEPTGDTRHRRAPRNKLLRKRGGRGREIQRAAKRRSHAHPLFFMEEVDVQKTELDQMRLEDAEAAHLMR